MDQRISWTKDYLPGLEVRSTYIRETADTRADCPNLKYAAHNHFYSDPKG